MLTFKLVIKPINSKGHLLDEMTFYLKYFLDSNTLPLP